MVYLFSLHYTTAPSGPLLPNYRGFAITLRHTIPGNSPLEKWSARSREIYLPIQNNHKRQSSMPPAEFEPAIPASQLYTARPLVSAQTVYRRFLNITSNCLLHKHQNIITKNKDTRAYFLPCFPEFVQKPDASNQVQQKRPVSVGLSPQYHFSYEIYSILWKQAHDIDRVLQSKGTSQRHSMALEGRSHNSGTYIRPKDTRA